MNSPSLSDVETLMWNLEADPWLNPSGAMVSVLDRTPKPKHLRRSLRRAIAQVPVLRHRVASSPTKLTNPTWEVDPEFDLEYHLPALALPEHACSWDDFLKLVTWIYQQPYDRTRPLWQVITIDGLEGGRSAIVWKLHHIIGDAETMMGMAEHYLQLKRREKMLDDVDLDQLFAADLAKQGTRPTNPVDALAESAAHTVSTVAKRQSKLARKALSEVATWGTNPSRAKEFGRQTASMANSTVEQLRGDGSPLWKERSRHRVLQEFQLPLDDLKSAAKRRGGSLNDLVVTGAVEGSAAYHARRDVALDALNVSFVVSTRKDSDDGGNAFVPMRFQAPTGDLSIQARFDELHQIMDECKKEARAGSGLEAVSSLANLLPTRLTTASARSQSAKLDIATSNFHGAPLPVFIAGAKLVQQIPIGPVAGTAFNLTVMSNDNTLDCGILIDPRAVDDPADLRSCLLAAYEELLDDA